MELFFIMIIIAFLFGDTSSSTGRKTSTSKSMKFKEHRPIRHPWLNSSDSSYHGKSGKTK